jgi:hypothetical protein
MLYGEGERAFFRLQEEIIKQTEDYSFLLWCGVPDDKKDLTPASRLPIFAPRPACFHRKGAFANQGPPLDYSCIEPNIDLFSLLPGHTPPSLWSPPQMTARGLRVSLPSKVSKGCHALWTGCLHGDDLVCIVIHGDTSSGPQCYVRSPGLHGRPEVLLLSTDRHLRSFTHAETYLSRSSTWLAIHNPLSPPSEACLDVILKSSENTTVTLGNCDWPLPSIPFIDLTAGDSRGTECLTTVHRAKSQYFYRPVTDDVKLSAPAWVLESDVLQTVLVEIDTQRPISSEVTPPQGTIRVDMKLKLPPARSTCCIFTRAESTGVWVPDSHHDNDRAECRLRNGEVVAVGIKHIRGANGCKRFILRVSVM